MSLQQQAVPLNPQPCVPPAGRTAAGLHGCIVVITGRRQQVLDDAVATLSAAGVTAAALQGDVRSADACAGWVADVLSRFGRLDVLVNCAAGNFLANAAELSQGGFRTGAFCAAQGCGRRQQGAAELCTHARLHACVSQLPPRSSHGHGRCASPCAAAAARSLSARPRPVASDGD